VKPEEDMRFQIRSASSLDGLEDSPWHGPTSTEDYYARLYGNNLLVNPSLENDFDGDDIPDYSSEEKWGTNDRTFTVVNDAYEGSKAVKVEITNYTSGDARWEILYNGTIEKDDDYLFSVWHKENADIGTIGMSIAIKKADGSMVWWYTGTNVQSSTNWKQDTFHFKTPIYEITEIRVKLVLCKEGWIISDAYNLEKTNFYDEWRINSIHNNSRWIQYKVDFSTADHTCSPSLHDVAIKYGASVPEIRWANILANDSRRKYAFEPRETANFNVEALDFKNITNIKYVNISIFDANHNLVLQDNMGVEADVSDVKRYYEYSYTFPGNATMGLWKTNIIAVNKDGQNCSENVFLKVREPYTPPPQKMTLGALVCDHGFIGDVNADIVKYSKYEGLEIWKLTINWDHLEPDHGSFNEDYVNKILEFMNGAHNNGSKVQIGIRASAFPSWANNGNGGDEEMYAYTQTGRLADTWARLANKLKDHPAMDSYLIINEENHIPDADTYLRSLNNVASSIRMVDGNLSHRITIRPNTYNSHIRTRIAQDGIQDYDYGTGPYPTSPLWYLSSYESPISETSYLRMAELRSSPIVYGGAGGVGEIGFFKAADDDTFGDDEKLAAFKRAMSIAYEQGMDEFMIWDQGSYSFADPETYFPQLKTFRDTLIMQPRASCFDVRVLIDNGEWIYTDSSPEQSALDMSNQPYRHLVETLDERGYSWFYLHVCYDATINFSEIKGKSEAEQDIFIDERLDSITPSGKRYLWAV
jgi:hypothetical protein